MKQGSSAAETMRQEAASALNAAGEQISLALRESQPEVEALGEALQQLANAVSRRGGPGPEELATVQATMAQAITRLQFYDRMTQHLSHVQDYLARSAEQIGGSDPAGSWTGVHQQLSEQLLSETQRSHLGKNFSAGRLAPAHLDPVPLSPDGDIELF